MGNNKKTISKINELSANLKQIKTHLKSEEDFSSKDLLTITDLLDEIDETSSKIDEKSKNIFAKESAKNISLGVQNLFGRIQEIETKRHLEDEEILTQAHQIAFKEDYLELNFIHLSANDIENILLNLDEEIQQILEKKPFNETLINPLIEKIRSKLIDLHFRFDFPIIEELDENKYSYAHRLVLMAKEIRKTNPEKADAIMKQFDELMDLVWISKLFMYYDMSKAQRLFDKLDFNLKKKIEKIVWRAKGENISQIKDDKKWVLPTALMNYVAQQINA